jgi:hypothetical protein
MAVVAVLSLAAGSQTANAQMAVSDPATEQASQITAANAAAQTTSLSSLLGLDTAWKALQTGWNTVQVYWEGMIGVNTGATGIAVAANGAATAQVITTGNQALLTSGYTNAVGAKVADQVMRTNTNDLAVTVCPPATVASGFSIARAGMANALKQTPPDGCAAGGVAMAGVGLSPADCLQAYSSTASTGGRIAQLATALQNFSSGGNGSDPTDSGNGKEHADTNVNNFFNDRTFTQADHDGFRTFEDLICGLPPENTPKNVSLRSRADGSTQLVNQHAQVAAFNLCVQVLAQYDAYHEPVTNPTAASALVSIYQTSVGSQMAASTALQDAAASGAFSMEDLLHALYQGIPEGGDSNGGNVFTQIAGLHDGMAALRMIATELIMTNYMEYERRTIEQQNLLINSAILARLDRGGIIQR